MVNVGHTEVMRTLLSGILEQLPDEICERFDVDGMLHGYSSFLKLSTKVEAEESKTKADKTYEQWYTVSIHLLNI